MMFCPQCGVELRLIKEQTAFKWTYRIYECDTRKVSWDWKLRLDGKTAMERCLLYVGKRDS